MMRPAHFRLPATIVHLALLLVVGSSSAQDRVALLIGNSSYGQQSLPAATPNLELLSRSLQKAGFAVTVKENVKNFRQELETFNLSCPDGGISLFYYYGYANRYQRKVSQTITQPDGSKQKVESLELTSGFLPIEKPPTQGYPLADITRTFRDRSAARFGIAVQWRRRHEFARANNLLMPLFDAVIRQRLQEPGKPLKPFPEEQGWLGDVSNWRDGEAKIGPFADFSGDRSKACWFPDEKTARAWQAFVTREPVLQLKSPPGLGDGQPLVVHKTGLKILVEIKGSPKTRGPVAVYAGAKKVGQLADGKLEIHFAEPGIYPLYLQGESETGKPLRSRPNTLLVIAD